MKVTLLLFFATHHFASSESIENSREFQNGNTLQSRKNLMKSSSSSTRSIQLAALGRVADLCDLYDDIIIKGINEELITQIEMTFQEMKEAKEYWNAKVINTRPVNKKEYFFINNEQGIVIIIDANTYDKVISYTDSEFASSIGAVVNNTFYSINTAYGTIKSTPLENIMTKNLSHWNYVDLFPKGECYSKNSAVVNGSVIYFTTCNGVLYKFDLTLKTVTKCADLIDRFSGIYGSMVLVDNILYIFRDRYFYSFDGDTLTSIPLFDERESSGLFQLGNNVCVVGGNMTDSSPNPDPVACYNPEEGSWKVHSYINEARKYPGVATSNSGVHIFGGYSRLKRKLTTSAEVLDVKTQKWSYIPSPLSNIEVNLSDFFMQTLTFHY